MQASPEQCDAVESLFTFVEEVAGIRQAKIKNLSKCDWKLDMRDVDPSLPGVLEVFREGSDDPTLLCRIELLDLPAAPLAPAELIEHLEGGRTAAASTAALVWKGDFGTRTLAGARSAQLAIPGVEAEIAETEKRLAEPAGERSGEGEAAGAATGAADAADAAELTALLDALRRKLEALRADAALLPLLEARDAWLAKRSEWLKERLPRERNKALFERFLTAREKLEASKLRSELLVGNFVFTSSPGLTETGEIADYPLVAQPIEITIGSSKRNLPLLEVRVDESASPRFLGEVVQVFAEERIDLVVLNELKEYVASASPEVLGDEALTSEIRNAAVRLSTACRWIDPNDAESRVTDAELEASGVKFRIAPRPVLFLQDRPTGIKEAVEAIRARIDDSSDIPQHLVEIVSPDAFPTYAPEDDRKPTLEEKLAATAGEDETILLTKPANTEQLAIARSIMRNDVVLVQGPPGTGKTHTIANLLGHFLAQGKRVLVTSQTTKALAVLKEKLPEEIQPLCVSVIQDKKDLERTAVALQRTISATTLTELSESIEGLEADRRTLTADLHAARSRLYALRLNETKGPVYQGVEIPIRDLAEDLRRNEALAGLIPGEPEAGPMPLTSDELRDLYATNGRWESETQRELSLELPASAELPTGEKMREMSDEYARLRDAASPEKTGIARVSGRSNAGGTSFLEYATASGARLLVKRDRTAMLDEDPGFELIEKCDSDPILRAALLAALDPSPDAGGADLFATLGQKLSTLDDAEREMIRRRMSTGLAVEFPKDSALAPEGGFAARKEAAEWFAQNAPEGRPGWFSRVFGKGKKMLAALSSVSVNGKSPNTREMFEAIAAECVYREKERETADRWNAVARTAGAPDFASFASFGEKGASAATELARTYGDILPKAAGSRATVVRLLEDLRDAEVSAYDANGQAIDLPLDAADADGKLNEKKAFEDPEGLLAALSTLVRDLLRPVHAYRHIEAELKKTNDWKADVAEKLLPVSDRSPVVARLAAALLTDPDGWSEAYEDLQQLERQRAPFVRRRALLEKLGAAAPEWRDALLEGRPGFEGTTVPADIEKAWDWKQKDRLYREWTSESPEALQEKAARLSRELRTNTARLAAEKAWYATKKRLEGSSQVSNLSKLVYYMKRASGHGKKVAEYRREANRLLPDCQAAVPVWIMMLQDALLNFNSAGRFDIVIVDEASQADLLALPVLYMADKVIVVGDDKQVTPLAVGTNLDTVDALARRFLAGRVKEPKLYNAQISLYDVIKTMGFPTHMLREHFRCVPEIIGYCNRLSYEGSIRPLRDGSSTNLKPAIVPYRVENVEVVDDATDAAAETRANRAEAEAVVRLMQAMIADPAYEGKTFGVISMRSGSQSQIRLLKNLIYAAFDPRDIEKRRILCGSSAEFQGDERDVILLSLVDSAAPGKMLRKLGDGNDDLQKKRWNVAVSRARDQLWIVHSFDPQSQLKHDDLRYGLFAWAREASRAVDIDRVKSASDSPFELEVATALLKRGFKVEQQYEVGAYRIDMVLSSRGRKAALECDGERYHSTDAQIRDDMERQTVLERNGWRFIRLRGSEYFRNKEAALERVVRDLKALGIEPETEGDVASGTPAATPLLARVLSNYERLAAGEALDVVETVEAVEAIEEPASEATEAADATETAEVTDATDAFEADAAPLPAKDDLVTVVPVEPAEPTETTETTETKETTDEPEVVEVVEPVEATDVEEPAESEAESEAESGGATASETPEEPNDEPHNEPLDPAELDARPFVRALLAALTTNASEPLTVTTDATGVTLLARSGAAAARIAASGDESEPITLEILRAQGLRARGLPAAVDKNGDYRVWRLDASEVGDEAQAVDLARRFAAYVQRVAVKLGETA